MAAINDRRHSLRRISPACIAISISNWLTPDFSFPRLTCTEPYFVSEGLYATPEELTGAREVTLHVMTIGAFIEDPAKVSPPLRKHFLLPPPSQLIIRRRVRLAK
ncbi:hypothetical protein KM043_016849 [Ampulex compressa]|nr:hypothetical protein KM043_016849 [Ampulex compressa]